MMSFSRPLQSLPAFHHLSLHRHREQNALLCPATGNPIVSLEERHRVMPCSGGLITGAYICERGAVRKSENKGAPIQEALHGSERTRSTSANTLICIPGIIALRAFRSEHVRVCACLDKTCTARQKVVRDQKTGAAQTEKEGKTNEDATTTTNHGEVRVAALFRHASSLDIARPRRRKAKSHVTSGSQWQLCRVGLRACGDAVRG